MQPYWLLTCAILVPGVLWASWIDYAERRVPNWLNAAILVAGLVAQAAFNGVEGAYQGMLGSLVGFAVLIVPWCMHAMGAGDVKLMAAIGMWFGPWMTCISFGLGAMIGGAIAVIMIVSTGRARLAMGNMKLILFKLQSRQTAFGDFGSARSFGETSQLLPYGVPLTIGSLIVLTIHVLGGGV